MVTSVQKKKALLQIDPYLSEPYIEEHEVYCDYVQMRDFLPGLYKEQIIHNRTPVFLRNEEVYITKNINRLNSFFSIRRKGYKSEFLVRSVYLKDAKIKLVPRKYVLSEQQVKLVFSGRVVAPEKLRSQPNYLGFHKPTKQLLVVDANGLHNFACKDCIEKTHQALDAPLSLVLATHATYIRT